MAGNPNLDKMASVAITEPFISRQHTADHLPMHVGQAAVDAVVAEDELLVVDAEEVEDCGVDIIYVDGVVDRSQADFV